MPIRFRCAYCNQLLGIARRKSGTVVKCPKCSGQVVVPQPPEEDEPARPPQPSPGAMFENNEIDKVLEGEEGEQPSVIATVGRAVSHYPVAVSALGDVRAPGIWLSSRRATMLSVCAVVALAVAFGAGLLVGMLIQSMRQR
jgi:phage FluMu protein Com